MADGELVELVRKLAAEFCDAQCALILNRKRLPHGRADGDFPDQLGCANRARPANAVRGLPRSHPHPCDPLAPRSGERARERGCLEAVEVLFWQY